MKKNILSFLAMLVLVSMISCSKLDSEEIELMNSSEVLMDEAPDSSLALLKSINLSDLYSKSAKARYALLYTKAQHKCFENIVNDSIINIAVEYYQRKGRDNDYAEALMYKGAALYDMMDYKEALNSYKLAEDILEGSDEYELLALINARIGELHRKLFSDVTMAIGRYKTAASYYSRIGNKKNEGRFYSLIGSRYIFIPNRDSALFYLHKSLDIAEEIVENTMINKNNYLLMVLHNNFNEYEDAIRIGVSAINGTGKITQNIIHKLCRAYAELGKIDSARIYFDRHLLRGDMGMSDYETLFIIEENAKNYKDALKHHKEVRRIADSIFSERRQAEIVIAEKRFDYQRVFADSMIIKEQNRTQFYIGLLIVSILIILIVVYFNINIRKNREKDSFIEHLRADTDAAKNTLLDKLSKKDITEARLRDILEKRMNALSHLMDISYRFGTNESLFLSEYNKIMSMEKLGKDVLIDICDVVNIKSGGMIDYISEHHPYLTKDDLCFIALVYSKFSPTAICTMFSYKKPDSVYVRKNRIANKMGLKKQLDSYLTAMVQDGVVTPVEEVDN